jgi:hypothetical protein
VAGALDIFSAAAQFIARFPIGASLVEYPKPTQEAAIAPFIWWLIILIVIVPAFRAFAGVWVTWLYVSLAIFGITSVIIGVQYMLECIFGAINWAAIFNPVVVMTMIVGGILWLLRYGKRDYYRPVDCRQRPRK